MFLEVVGLIRPICPVLKVKMNYKIDHLVFGCNNLIEGSSCIEDLFKIKLSNIGYHKTIGTHNRVLKIGDIYLEVIALDPKSKVNKSNSFFNLNNNYVKKNILKDPRLISFVISSNTHMKSSFYLQPHYVERGEYKWNFYRPNSKKIDKKIFSYPDAFPSVINWFSHSPIKDLQNNLFSFDSLEINLNKNQNDYKNFLEKFNLKEKIIFKFSQKRVMYDLPRLRARIIDKKNKKVFFIQ